MSKHYDTLETRTPAEREKALMQALPQQLAHAKANAPFFKDWLKDVDPAAVTSREALAKLPVLRKSMLGEVQKKNPPMGGLIAVPMSKVRHVFMSPGPIFEIDTDEPDYFRGARAMHAAGFRPGQVVYNTFDQNAVLGKASMQVSQLLKLGRGAVVELDRKVGEAIDIYVNNRLVARGEVVVVDDRLGVTMTEIVKVDRS